MLKCRRKNAPAVGGGRGTQNRSAEATPAEVDTASRRRQVQTHNTRDGGRPPRNPNGSRTYLIMSLGPERSTVIPTDGPEEHALLLVGELQDHGSDGYRYTFEWWTHQKRRGSVWFEQLVNGVVDSRELVANVFMASRPPRVEVTSDSYDVHGEALEALVERGFALTISDQITCPCCRGEGYEWGECGVVHTGSGFGDARPREIHESCDPCEGTGVRRG